MQKYPSEIFGYYWADTIPKAKKTRENYHCPFVAKPCYKKSRLIKYPFGVCTAHVDEHDIALCPRRFLDGGIVFKDIAKAYFGTTNNILVFSEVGLKGIGNFDFVMIRHKPLSATIEDFVVVEFQTGQTTSTGHLVRAFRDFIEKRQFNDKKAYSFGINYYDIWKRTFTQILNKGIILEKWNKKIFWVIQRPVFDYFLHKYRLGSLSYDKAHASVFALYDLKQQSSHLDFQLNSFLSSSVDDLFNAFRKNDEIPPVDEFIKKLEAKVSSDIKLSLRLDAEPGHLYLDINKPTSTGRVREGSDDDSDE
jgi:hypothetical protein